MERLASPSTHASRPAGLRVGTVTLGQAENTANRAGGGQAARGLLLDNAVARFAGHGHLLIDENGFADQARSLLQALALRLAAARTPGPCGSRWPIRWGMASTSARSCGCQPSSGWVPGVATTTAEIEALLAVLAGHVVEVIQTRLTNVYESVEAYDQASTGTAVPYQLLVLAGFPSGISDRAAETLTRLAHAGPRAGVYIVATLDSGQEMPRGFDLAELTALGTNLRLASPVSLSWDDPT